MTLDEAIKHAEEIAESRCDECGREHRQLVEWLKELKEYREQEQTSPCDLCRFDYMDGVCGDCPVMAKGGE